MPPNELTKALDVVEDDEPKVFSLMAEEQHEETSNISDLSTIKARLSVDYFADENYHDIMETLKNDMTNEEVVRYGRFSWKLPTGQLFRRDDDGVDKVCVVTGDVEWVLKVAHGTWTSGHFGVRMTLSRVRECFWWPSMQKSVIEWIRKCDLCKTFLILLSEGALVSRPSVFASA